MNWLFDLGNTRIKCAPLLADGRCGPVRAFAHGDEGYWDAAAAAIGPVAPGAVAWLASVAAPARAEAVDAGLRGLGFSVRRARTQARCGRLQVAYARPERLGVDRFLALLAASAREDGPWLLVSVGSAMTVDLLDADGRHLGGAIATTPEHAREALALRFPALALAPGRGEDLFAADSADAVAAGTRAAATGLTELARREAYARLGVAPTVLLTGGGIGQLAPIEGAKVEPGLVLDGLARYVVLAGSD